MREIPTRAQNVDTGLRCHRQLKAKVSGKARQAQTKLLSAPFFIFAF